MPDARMLHRMTTMYDLEMKSVHGDVVALSDYANTVLLIVNVASY